jgi:two-component system nitrogen regulation sensor histidine kinase NtrY
VVPPSRRSSTPRRKPLLDNTPLLLAGVIALVVALAGLLALGRGSSRLAPDFLTDVVLAALSATNLTILVALAFVLARNIVKLVMERRRALPFARFRARLVAVLLGMAVVPAVLVLLVGSELIRTSVDRWFNQPMDEMLSSANAIAGDYYAQQQDLVSAQAQRFARALAGLNLATASASDARDLVAPDVLQERIDLVEVYRLTPGPDGRPRVTPVVDVASPSMPREYSRASADRLAERTATAAADGRLVEQLPSGGDLSGANWKEVS